MNPPDRCPVCDRAECPRCALRNAGMPSDVRAVHDRMHQRFAEMERFVPTSEERRTIRADKKRHAAAEADCEAHRVDWRARYFAERVAPEEAEWLVDEYAIRLLVVNTVPEVAFDGDRSRLDEVKCALLRALGVKP